MPNGVGVLEDCLLRLLQVLSITEEDEHGGVTKILHSMFKALHFE